MQITLVWKAFFIEWSILSIKIRNKKGKTVQYNIRFFITITQVVACVWPDYCDADSANVSALDFTYLGGTAWDNIDCTLKQLTTALCLLISSLLVSFSSLPLVSSLALNQITPLSISSTSSSTPNRHALRELSDFTFCHNLAQTYYHNFWVDADLLWEGSTVEARIFSLRTCHCISQGPSGAKTCPMALPSPAWVCLFLEKNNQLPVLAPPDLTLHLYLCLILIFQLGSPFCLPDSGFSQVVGNWLPV